MSKPILHRLIYGYVIIFLAAISLTGLWLFCGKNLVLIPKWRAISGLLLLLAISSFVFCGGNKKIINEGLGAGLLLALISLFFVGSNPMHQYVAIRHVNPNGNIETDEVFLRSAHVVRMLESDDIKKSKRGRSIFVERYLYSPRIGLLLGKSLGEGNGSPEIGYELYGISAWLFGIRVACEQFSFFAINLTPILVAYGLYCHWKKKPLRDSLALDPVKALFLTGPFVIGLIPILGN